MKIISGIQGLRDIKEHSAFKDYAAANPDWMESPEGVEKAVSIAPSLAYQGATLGQQIYNQRMQRAGSRLIYQNTADQSAHQAYTEHLAANPGDFAGAQATANERWQRYLDAAETQYGPEFANNLKKIAPTWDLNGYAQRAPVYDQLLGAMRQPTQVQLTDPNTGQRTTRTVYLLPGTETQNFLRDNAPSKPILLKQGETAPPAYQTVGGSTGPLLNTSTGQLSENPIFAQQQASRQEFNGLDMVHRYHVAEPAYMRGMAAAAEGAKAAQEGTNPMPFDTQLMLMFAQQDMGSALVGVNTVDALAQQSAITPAVQRWLNFLMGQGGQFTPEQRKSIAEALHTSYLQLRNQYQGARDYAGHREKANGWAENTITGYSPMQSMEAIEGAYKAATAPSAPAGPVGTGNFDTMSFDELRNWGQQNRDAKTGKIRFKDARQKAQWDAAMQFQLSRGQGNLAAGAGAGAPATGGQ